jgi:hypothetical protein
MFTELKNQPLVSKTKKILNKFGYNISEHQVELFLIRLRDFTGPNCEFVKKAQNTLKHFGFEISISKCYQLFSQIGGFNNWNVACASNLDFKKLLKDVSVLTPNNQGLERYPDWALAYISMLKEPSPLSFQNFELEVNKIHTQQIVRDLIQPLFVFAMTLPDLYFRRFCAIFLTMSDKFGILFRDNSAIMQRIIHFHNEVNRLSLILGRGHLDEIIDKGILKTFAEVEAELLKRASQLEKEKSI